MKSGKPDTEQALSAAGRYQSVSDNLEVKEIVIGASQARKRYVLVRNSKQAAKDKEHREKVLDDLKKELKASRDSENSSHNKAECRLLSYPTNGCYLKILKSEVVKIDPVKVKTEEKLYGKYLLRICDDMISSEDVAVGYKQLIDIEAVLWTLKSNLDLRPVYHRLEDLIRAQIMLCRLALLLVRIAEHETGDT